MATAHWYTDGLLALSTKKVDWVNDAIQCLLVRETYTPNQDGDTYISDLTGVLSGSGYAHATVTGKTATTSAGVLTLDCADVAFSAFTASPGPRYAVFAVNTGVAGTSSLLCWIDFGSATSVTAQPATVTIPSTGLMAITAA